MKEGQSDPNFQCRVVCTALTNCPRYQIPLFIFVCSAHEGACLRFIFLLHVLYEKSEICKKKKTMFLEVFLISILQSKRASDQERRQAHNTRHVTYIKETAQLPLFGIQNWRKIVCLKWSTALFTHSPLNWNVSYKSYFLRRWLQTKLNIFYFEEILPTIVLKKKCHFIKF